MTPEQVQLIKATVPVLRQYGTDITSSFYKDMLANHPELNDIFNRTNQINGHQASALADSLYAYASHIDDLGVLAPAVEHIVQKHASLYVQPEQYDIVGTYLLKAMKDILGDALTEDIQAAVCLCNEPFPGRVHRRAQLTRARISQLGNVGAIPRFPVFGSTRNKMERRTSANNRYA